MKPVDAKGRRPVKLIWPKDPKARRQAFNDWHAISMQVLHRLRLDFRLIAVFPRFFNFESGTLWPSTKTLAEYAGGCSERTVKNNLANYRDAAIIEISTVRMPGDKHPTRIIRPAFPSDLRSILPRSFLPDDDEQSATKLPPEIASSTGEQRANSFPFQGATRLPPTIEENHEKGARLEVQVPGAPDLPLSESPPRLAGVKR